MQIRLHVLAVPETITCKEYTVCAFTQKILNCCKMFKDLGMHVIHYGHEDSKVNCNEHVTVITREVYEQYIGNHDWKNKGLKQIPISEEPYLTFNRNALIEINKRKQPNDIVLAFYGVAHQAVCNALPDLLCVEPSIGYLHTFAKYKVYESYSVMHGLQGKEKIEKAEFKAFDAVIHSGFDLKNFEYSEKKDNYFMMCGRIIASKGVTIAIDVTKRLGYKLILAGTSNGPKDCGIGDKWPEHVEYIGYANVETRKKLMSKAKALFCPTFYNEPFGFVAIESMLSGTPVITVDWGGFTETVLHGITGYRCRTFEQFLWAAKNIDTISPKACRQWAETNFNFNRIGKMYKEYFTSLLYLRTPEGFYKENPDRKELEWLGRSVPEQKKTFKELVNWFTHNSKIENIKNLQFVNETATEDEITDETLLDLNWETTTITNIAEVIDGIHVITLNAGVNNYDLFGKLLKLDMLKNVSLIKLNVSEISYARVLGMRKFLEMKNFGIWMDNINLIGYKIE
jgi:glycosyltransferase involved in cell wall biosynthesis